MSVAKIERLTVGEEARLRLIRLRALADAPNAFGTAFDEANSFPTEEWQRQLLYLTTFVATTREGDVGIVRAAPREDCTDGADLLSLWVAPEMRRRGIAGALVDAVVAWAQGAAYQRLVLEVTEDNDAAVALYRAKGFIPNGIFGAMPPPRQAVRECQMEMQLIG